MDRYDPEGGCVRCKTRLYWFAILVTGLIAWFEFWGSGITGSRSLFADAWHVVSDGMGYLIGVFALRMVKNTLSGKQSQVKRRFEVLVASFILVVGLHMFVTSAGHIYNREIPLITSNRLLVVVAFVGLMANLFLFFLFRALRVGHGHGGHNHVHEDGVLQMNIVHTLGDAATSFMVLMNALLFLIFPDRRIVYLDLLVSCVIALWLIWQALGLLISPHVGHKHTH